MSEELPPGTGLIAAIRAERSPYHSWAGEVLDNAFDAAATSVHLGMTAASLDAKDNGFGVSPENDKAMVQISEHGEMPSTKLGRFGVGLKYKSIQHGRRLHIQSVSAHGRLRRIVDWEEMQRTNRWIYGDALRTPVPPSTPTGTFVSIRDLITRTPAKADCERVRKEIQRRYYPILEEGGVITLNDEPIEPIGQPPLRDVVEATLEFPDGRVAKLRAGMLVDPHTARLRQIDICIAYRVIVPESDFACDGYGGIRSMFGQIVLLGPWQVTKFKDSFADDPYEEELEERVAELLKPLLEQCQSESMYLKTKHLEDLLNEMLPQDRRLARPQRKQKLDREGEKRGEKREKELAGSEEARSGPVKKRRPPRGMLIEFAQDLHATYGFGRALVGKSTRIQLAADNPHIKILMNQRDEQVAKLGLFAIATLIYEGDLQIAEPRLMDEPIGQRAWKLAGQQNSGQPELDAA